MTRLALALFAIAATAPAQQQPNGLYAVFETSLGSFTARLFEKDTPHTVANFVSLANGTQQTLDPKTHKPVNVRLYDHITFHRVVPGEMIQSGDPTGTGTHNCGFTIRDEVLPGLRFDGAGKLAMANTGEPNSGGCQFFITVEAMRQWNGKYTIFGVVVEGQNVVNKIGRGPVREDRPIDPVKLISLTIKRVGPPPVKKPRK